MPDRLTDWTDFHMESYIAVFPTVLLFTDGAFSFAHRFPGFGWVAADPVHNREIARHCRPIRNDGTANTCAEAASAASALEWALRSGFRRIRLHTDCRSLSRHVRMLPRPRLREARRLFRVWQEVSSVAAVEIVRVHPRDPHLRTAHHLAQCGMIGTDSQPDSGMCPT